MVVLSMNSSSRKEFLQTLKARFEQHMHRHMGLSWEKVQAKLEASITALRSLGEMEQSGGEPDVSSDTTRRPDSTSSVTAAPKARLGVVVSATTAKRSTPGRRTSQMAARRELAAQMGVELLSEQQYRQLQELGKFDTKTSSWIATPDDVRSLGGALFCDRRYGKVFVYHNGAESYYAARGFRALIRV